MSRCPKSPSFLRSTTRLPTLVDSSSPCRSDPARLSNGLRRGGRSPGGRDRPRAHGGRGSAARPVFGKLSASVRQTWYPTSNVGASEAIQISANRAECVRQWTTSLAGRHFTLSSPAILFTDNAAPCRKPLSRMLSHPVGELRCAHQAGLHGQVSEFRGGDGLLVAICRRRQTAEHSDDRDHDRPSRCDEPLRRCAYALRMPFTCSRTESDGGKTLS